MEVNLVQPVSSSNARVAACMIVPEILKEDNYESWCIFMEHYLVAQDLWDVVSIERPPTKDAGDWVKKNALALHAIKISCGVESFDQIKKMNLAQRAWNALANLHKQPNEDVSRGSEADTEVEETWTRILGNNVRTEILNSLRHGNWNALKNLDRITEILFPGGFTILHIASILGHLNIVRELVNIVGEDYLEIQDNNGNTALSLAAACKSKKAIAECLVQKHDKLLTIQNKEGYIPLVVACINKQKKMARYLYSTTDFKYLLPENSNQGALFLKYCALNLILDVGLDLLFRCPRLAVSRESITILDLSRQPSLFYSGATLHYAYDMLLYHCPKVVKLPSPSVDAVSPRTLEIFKRQVARVEVMDKILRRLFFIWHRRGKLRHIYRQKLTHRYANLVLRHWCKEISACRDVTQLVKSGAISVIFRAIKQGTYEIVIRILKANPDLIWCNEKLARDLLFSAIKYREFGLLRFVTEFDAGKKSLLSLKDKDGNNALHLVAKLPECHYESVGIHAAWTMTVEEWWFEKIKIYLPCWYQEDENLYGETPEQVFYWEHQELITNMQEWGKRTAKSYTLASVLIVTIMFAALFTVPGGIDEKTGMPKLLHMKQLYGFLICDAVSFITASTSFFGFLSVLTLTSKRGGRRRALPFQLLFAISTLIISLVTLILAFIFALAVMLENKWRVLPALIIYLLVVFAVLLYDWQVPTLLSLLGITILQKKPDYESE